VVTSTAYQNQGVCREFAAAKMDKATAGGERSNFAAAACLINVDGLYNICRE
jgi:hypothetical protein